MLNFHVLSLFPSFLEQSLLYLSILTDSLDDVVSSECYHDNQEAVHRLGEALDLVFGCLRRKKACRMTEKEGGVTNDVIVPKNAFQSFKSFILSSVSFLEIMLKVSDRLLCSAVHKDHFMAFKRRRFSNFYVRELFSFSTKFHACYIYLLRDVVLIREASLFQGCPHGGAHISIAFLLRFIQDYLHLLSKNAPFVKTS